MTNTYCLSTYVRCSEYALFSAHLHCLLPQEADPYRLHHPSSRANRLQTGLDQQEAARRWSESRGREKEGYFFPVSSCLVPGSARGSGPPGLQCLLSRPSSKPQSSLGLPVFPASCWLICGNSFFIKCTSLVSSEWNSIFCWDSNWFRAKEHNDNISYNKNIGDRKEK